MRKDSSISYFRAESAFTLTELLVSLVIFNVICLSMVVSTSSALHNLAAEENASVATQELRSSLELMSTELRMSSSLSPYLVGTTPSTVTCSSAFSLTANTIKFLVVQDENAATTSGLQPYYVGYWYDSSNKQLLRGEIRGSTITSCTVPAGNPTDAATAVVLANNVVTVDSDGDGTVDDPFVTSGNGISINLGIEVNRPRGEPIVQPMPISINRRTP